MDEVAGVMEQGRWYSRREIEEALGAQTDAGKSLGGLFAMKRVNRRERLDLHHSPSRWFEWTLA